MFFNYSTCFSTGLPGYPSVQYLQAAILLCGEGHRVAEKAYDLAHAEWLAVS
jgi:hypothetical protein